MDGKWTIYHNPKCGTSRKVLDYLRSKKIEPEIVEYLRTPPTVAELDGILKKAGLEPEQIVRRKEELFKRLQLDDMKLSRQQWIKILSDNPILIERPIVVHGAKALLARPPETIEQFA